MLRPISLTLRDLIEAGIPDHAAGWVVVASLSEQDTLPADSKLVVFLYAVHEHPQMRNLPPLPDAGGYRRPPAVLRLSYLITYMGTHEEAQTRLAQVVQVFHERPRLGPNDLHPDLHDRVDELAVRLTNPGPEEVNQIWTALNRGMRLSLYYQVDVALIDAGGPRTRPVESFEGSLEGVPAR